MDVPREDVATGDKAPAGLFGRLWKRASDAGLEGDDGVNNIGSTADSRGTTPVKKGRATSQTEKVIQLRKQELKDCLLLLSQRKELWVQDSEVTACFLCAKLFSAIKRRHHCRLCGKIVCRKCSKGNIQVSSSKVIRCCDACLDYVVTTPEEEALPFFEKRLKEEARTPKVRGIKATLSSDSESDGDSHNMESDSTANNYLLPDDRRPPRRFSASEAMIERNSVENMNKVNAQLSVTIRGASNLNLSQECKGVYCVLSLGKQQTRTLLAQSNTMACNAEWNEEMFFDITDLHTIFKISVWAQYFTQEVSGFLGEVTIPLKILVKHEPGVDRDLQLATPQQRGSSKATICIRSTYKESKDKVTPEDFQLMKVVGRGNFGKVLQVRKKDSNNIYAMKVLRKDAVIEHDAVEHTIAERNVLRRIRHPFIVGLKYSFQTHDKLYLVLDYLCGGELFTHLSSVDYFSEERTRFYAAQIILALGHLHEMDIIYRDLKPENLMLDMDGFLCLTDFGLCKENISHNEKTRTFCGSPEYLAPEILKGKPYGKAVDWWALGTFIYEMLSGWPPFFDENPKRMNRRILFEKLTFEPPELFSKDARSLLRGLLEREPEKRLGTGAHGTDDIMNHPFFKNVNWEDLYNRRVEPPFKPHLVCFLLFPLLFLFLFVSVHFSASSILSSSFSFLATYTHHVSSVQKKNITEKFNRH
ncbi:Serine/threonine-protein kinase [Balamuthia mandrillaris]